MNDCTDGKRSRESMGVQIGVAFDTAENRGTLMGSRGTTTPTGFRENQFTTTCWADAEKHTNGSRN